MPLNKKICPQNKYLRFPIHKFAQPEKSTPKQNLPLKKDLRIPQTENCPPPKKKIEIVQMSKHEAMFLFEHTGYI